jgi:head-tail adaptor
MLLDPADIAAFRAVAEQALPDIATIQRGTETSDQGGGTTTEWNPIAESVPCRLSPVAGGEMGMVGARVSDEATSMVTMAATRDVLEADRLIIAGITYDVTLVRRRGAWALTLRIECKEAA